MDRDFGGQMKMRGLVTNDWSAFFSVDNRVPFIYSCEATSVAAM
jgi:hypothetical protein